MKHHQSPWIIMSISGLCTIGHIFMILCDVCFKYRFYNSQPQSVMCLREGPINTAVQQDGHRDMKTCLDRNVKTVKNSPDSETWSGHKVWALQPGWYSAAVSGSSKTFVTHKLSVAVALHREVKQSTHWWQKPGFLGTKHTEGHFC